jgi:hypothetical protein
MDVFLHLFHIGGIIAAIKDAYVGGAVNVHYSARSRMAFTFLL